MKIELKAPKNYSEMTIKQTRYVATLQLAGLPQETIWAKCFFKFTELKLVDTTEDACIVKYGKHIVEVNPEEVNEFIQQLSWLTRKYIGINPPANIGNLQPCQSLFENLKFETYLEAENEIQAYLFTQKNTHLVNLMALLYRSKYRHLQPIEKRVKRLSKCSATDKMVIFMWVLGVKEFFTNKFKLLFAAEPHEDGQAPQAPDMYEVMQNQIRALTAGDITKREAVLQSLTWDALEELNNKIRESKEMQKTNS